MSKKRRRTIESRFESGPRKRWSGPEVQNEKSISLDYDDVEIDKVETYERVFKEPVEKGQKPQKLYIKDTRSNKSSGQETYTSGVLDETSGQRPVFPGTWNSSNNVEGPPLNAANYLQAVRQEAHNRPSFVTANNNPSGRVLVSYQDSNSSYQPKEGKPQDGDQRDSSLDMQAIETSEISERWSNSFLDNYRNARKHVEALQTIQTAHTHKPRSLPKSSKSWKLFILSPEHSPTISQVLSFGHPLNLQLLQYSSSWITSSMTPELSRWLFALLVCISDTLSGEEIAILRELAKRCLEVKNSNDNLDLTTRYSLDMIISIVGGCYGQRDLLGAL